MQYSVPNINNLPNTLGPTQPMEAAPPGAPKSHQTRNTVLIASAAAASLYLFGWKTSLLIYGGVIAAAAAVWHFGNK